MESSEGSNEVQILFCLETSQKADTDWVYIHETIERFYVYGTVRLRPVYMETKMNLFRPKAQKKIGRYTKEYMGETVVVVCTDTDCYDTDCMQKEDNEKINTFCSAHQYKSIWFCRDIEEVYTGKCIAKKDKVDVAEKFRKKRCIEQCSEKKLSQSAYAHRTSNILNVLNELLERKCVY